MNENNKSTKIQESVIVAHPAQQHSYRLATALEKKGLLHSYCTTIYYKPNKLLYRILSMVLGPNDMARMKNRRNLFFESKVKQFNQLLGLLFILFIRIDKKMIIEPVIYKYLTTKFGKNVAKYAMRRNGKVVIMYDKTGYSCFRALDKNSNIIKILDMSSAAAPYIVKIINKDKDNGHDFINSHDRTLKAYSDNAVKTYTDELFLADYFLVASDFVRKSLLDTGVKSEQIYLVPYGVEVNKFTTKSYDQDNQEKLRFLFVGHLEAVKGIYYLLEAFKQINRQDIQLVLVGDMQGQDDLFRPYKQYFTHLGVKLANEMPDIYKSADIFIFPSLYEGFSLALMEAMASGLPVIASYNSGVNDIITDGKEGFTIPSMDIEALKEKIIWFCDNRANIQHMGQNSRKLAELYTWMQYEENVSNVVLEILEKEFGDSLL